MIQKVHHKNVTWIDIPQPDEDDILYLNRNFNIHPLAIEEFVTPTFRPKASIFKDCLFMTIHIPLFNVETKTTYPSEIDIVLTRTHLITGHKDEIFQFSDFFEKLSKSAGKRQLHMSSTPAHLLYAILEILLDTCFPRLDNITRKIDSIEEDVFGGKEKEMVREISIVKRDILNFRRTLMPQRSVLESITQSTSPFVPQELIPYFTDLVATNIRLWNTLQNAKETIESLQDTNESLLSNKINEKMRIITIFSSVLLPMTLYANVLGINVSMPFNDSSMAFWIHLGIMSLLSIITLSIFKLAKWV